MGMKICVLIIFLVLPWISRVGDWALKWTEGDEALQVIFVMLVFPVIMNATQYYIIDSFIKNQKPEHEPLAGEEEEEDEDRRGERHQPYEDPASGSSDEIHSGDEEDEEVLAKEAEETKSKAGRGSKSGKGLKMGSKDYDPLFDGESTPTTVVGSASASERDRLVAKEAESDTEDVAKR